MSLLEERLYRDQKEIRQKIADQAEAVETAVKNAIHSLKTGNRKLAYSTILNDYPVNRTMREIDRMCHSFIAVHLPSGTYLRLISSIIRVNIELERMGDYAVVIAREGIRISSPPTGVLGVELDRMTADTLTMVQQAIRAFNEQNADLARATKHLSDNIQYNLDAVYNEIMNNTELQDVKDSLALFVVFNQLKRVVDQAKNICEDTVFAVTGQQKKPKVYNVMFIDEENSLLSPLAESIARKNHSERGSFSSAGRTPAGDINPALAGFLAERVGGLEEVNPTSLADLTTQELSDQHVIVSLQGDVSSYIEDIPFHTSVLEWDLGPIPENPGAEDIEALYRNLALQVKDLMDLMCGEEV